MADPHKEGSSFENSYSSIDLITFSQLSNNIS